VVSMLVASFFDSLASCNWKSMPKHKKKDSKGSELYNVKKNNNHQGNPDQDSDVVCDE